MSGRRCERCGKRGRAARVRRHDYGPLVGRFALCLTCHEHMRGELAHVEPSTLRRRYAPIVGWRVWVKGERQ